MYNTATRGIKIDPSTLVQRHRSTTGKIRKIGAATILIWGGLCIASGGIPQEWCFRNENRHLKNTRRMPCLHGEIVFMYVHEQDGIMVGSSRKEHNHRKPVIGKGEAHCHDLFTFFLFTYLIVTPDQSGRLSTLALGIPMLSLQRYASSLRHHVLLHTLPCNLQRATYTYIFTSSI